jgi:hypothetical protein
MSLLRFLDQIELRRRMTRPYGNIMALITPLFTLVFVISLVSFQLLHFTFVEARTQGQSEVIPEILTPDVSQNSIDKAADGLQSLQPAIGLRPGHNGRYFTIGSPGRADKRALRQRGRLKERPSQSVALSNRR